MSKLIAVSRYLTNQYPTIIAKVVLSNYWGALVMLQPNIFPSLKCSIKSDKVTLLCMFEDTFLKDQEG